MDGRASESHSKGVLYGQEIETPRLMRINLIYVQPTACGRLNGRRIVIRRPLERK